MTPADWSSQEEQVARHVFDNGRKRSIELLISTLQDKCQTLSTDESVWNMHDYLSTERHTFEGRSEFDYNNILFIPQDPILSLPQRQDLSYTDFKHYK